MRPRQWRFTEHARHKSRGVGLAGLVGVAVGLGVLTAPPALGLNNPPVAITGIKPPPPIALSAGTTIHVNTTLDETNPGDGTCSLREAVDWADGTREPDCASGSPFGSTLIEVPAASSHYFLTQGEPLNIDGNRAPVLIRGGGVGPLGTTIDGGGVGPVIVVGEGSVTLNGLTVTGGQAASASVAGGCGGFGCGGVGGGGIVNAASLTLNEVAVTDNASGYSGAGVDGGAGGTGGNGGGILNFGTLNVDFSTISDNHTGNGGNGGNGDQRVCGQAGGPAGAGGSGGGIYNSSGAVSVVGTTISANTTGGGGVGGAGRNERVFPTCAGGDGGDGGAGGAGAGVYNHGGTLTVSDSAISGNTTGGGGTGGGGGDGCPPSNPEDQGCVACYGTSGGSGGSGGVGGGIAGDLGLSVLNSTIVGNVAGAGGPGGEGGNLLTIPIDNGASCPEETAGGGAGGVGGAGGGGGGVAQVGGGATLTNLTIANNAIGAGGPGQVGDAGLAAGVPGAPGAGGGILVSGGSLTEANTIIENDCGGPVTDGGDNLVLEGISPLAAPSCPGLNSFPLLGPLQNNGGSTETMALGSGSPAIDEVPATTTTCPATDQRGYLRPDAGESGCDIGAYESGASPSQLHFVSALTVAPRYFGLQPRGNESRGVTVTALLHKPRFLVLLVRKVLGRRLVLVAIVGLGPQHAGRSLTHWNLRLRGRLLPQGRYQLVMCALDNGNLLSPPANPGARTLTVQKDGRVRASSGRG